MNESTNTRSYEQWLDAHPLRYDTGEEVQPGDEVDFGFDGKFSNGPSIDVADLPWVGEVVRREGLRVIVDTHLNSYRSFEPSDLRFMGRAEHKGTDAPAAAKRGDAPRAGSTS